LIRSVTNMLAAAGSVAVLAGGMALTGGAASAATLPSCLGTGYHCTNSVAAPGSIFENGGTGGYYGADDNHTHYRFVQTVVTASPQLVDVNGPVSSLAYPATVGVELCDPNSGITAQISLFYYHGSYDVAYVVGKGHRAADRCIQDNFINGTGTIFKAGTPLGLNGISTGDKIYLAIYYTPGGRHQHQLSFGVCDETTGVCRQAYTSSRFQLEFWEFGIGTFVPLSVLTGGAVNEFETFSSDIVTCYSCTTQVPISSVSAVGGLGGGLYEAEFSNSSSQLVMSPNDTLSGSTFNMYNGSTSI
jgi:hypothetical protein